MKKISDKIKQAIGELLDFHARVWVVNVYAGEHMWSMRTASLSRYSGWKRKATKIPCSPK